MKTTTRNLPSCTECAIRSSALFGELETEQLDKARALRSSQVHFKAGEYLYHQGDIPDKAFTIYSGWVSLFKNLENGDRQILRFALPGDFLCYKVGRQRMLDHSALALSDVTLCSFPLERFRNTIEQVPELAMAISSITDLILQRCNNALTSIASHPAETKIAYLLLSLFVRELHLRGDEIKDNCIPFPITQEDIGDALGLTAIHVNRVFQSLRKKGLIECKNKCLWVPDQNELAKVAKISLQELKRLMVAI